MRPDRAREIVADMDRYVHHDRVFLNNPAVMQGMGLAPLVIAATTGRYALMLWAAVALLLTPTRVLSCLALRRVHQPLLRVMGYSGIAACVYIGVRALLGSLLGNDLLELGIYLPMLVVDPLVIYRGGRVAEPLHKAVSKGLRITVGYGLILVLTGCLRELLAGGTVFGAAVAQGVPLPFMSLPAGGFILVGVLFAIWRALCAFYKDYVRAEAKREE